MDILNASDTDFRKKLQAITSRGEADTSKVEDAVKEIITGIRRHGDKALFSYTNRFDGLSIDKKTIRVSDAEFRNARKAVSKGIVESLKRAPPRPATTPWPRPLARSDGAARESESLGQMVRP